MTIKEIIRKMQEKEAQIRNDDLDRLQGSLHYIDRQFKRDKSENNEQHKGKKYAVASLNYIENNEERKQIINFLESQGYKVVHLNTDCQSGDLEKCFKKEKFLGGIYFFKSTEEVE